MASVDSPQENSTSIRIGSKLSAAFERMEERIRERAYQIFQERAPGEGDSITDWLDAQMQILAPIDLVVTEQKKNVVIEGNLKGFSPKEIEVEVGTEDLRVFGLHTESTTGKKRGATQSSSKTVKFAHPLNGTSRCPGPSDSSAYSISILKFVVAAVGPSKSSQVLRTRTSSTGSWLTYVIKSWPPLPYRY